MASAACDGAGEGRAGPDSPGPDPASPQADLRRAAVGASAAARAASGGIEKGVDLPVALGAGAGLLAAVCARDNAFLRRPAIPGGQCGASPLQLRRVDLVMAASAGQLWWLRW